MKEFSDGNHGLGVREKVKLLREQLRSGDLPKGREYRLNTTTNRFEVLTPRSRLRSLLSELSAHGKTDLARRKARLCLVELEAGL